MSLVDEDIDADDLDLLNTHYFLGPSNINPPQPESSEYIIPQVQYDIRELSPSATSPSKSCNDSEQDYDNGHCSPGGVEVYSDDPINIGPRLQGPIPFDGGFVAFGTIQLYERFDPAKGEDRTFIRGCTSDDIYPNYLIRQGLVRRWIRTDGLSIGTKGGISTLRVYILPEDIERSDQRSVKDFRKLVRYLINYIDCSIDAWQGKKNRESPIENYQEPLLDEEESLFYIFNTLKSPKADLEGYNGDVYSLEAITAILNNTTPGLKTQLYPYQQRSVVAMLKRESDPAKIRDLRKFKYLDMYGKEFLLDLKDGSLCHHRPFYTEPQGGVLAETMGYGKTLICLALILATRGHYSRLPYQQVEVARNQQYLSVPSLLEIAARRLRHEGLPWKQDFYNLCKQGLHYDRCVSELQKYERVYNASQNHSALLNPTRKGKPEYMVPVRLCSVTLIIVPPNLIVQWQQEIQRHIDPDALDLLVLSRSDVAIPSWEDLVKYDIVLISKARFEQEYRDDDLNQGRMVRGAIKYKSPLTAIRWLRVICDEGHGFAGSSSKTKAMAMLDKMAIDRRWVVSGTPSSTLHGVEVGLAAMGSITPEKDSMSRESSLRAALTHGQSPQSVKTEKYDFERLRLMVVNFLKLQPWANRKGDDKADFKDYLAPRVDKNGVRRSVPALREVLQTLIIRHRIEDIDRDLILPTLYNKVVYIKPSYYDKLTINLFIMILTSNYVTSEREDEDYMFHPKNHKKLSTLINNMSVATFHWMGITEKDVRSTVKISDKYLDEHIDTISDHDGALITEAIMTGEKALADPGWRAFSTMHEIGTFVTDFPENAREAWALDGLGTDPLLMGTTQAREVQRHFQAGLLSNEIDPLHGIVGAGLKTMNAARGKAHEFQKQNDKSNNESGEASTDVGTKGEPKVRAFFTSQTPVKLTVRRSSVKSPAQSNIIQDGVITEKSHVPDTRIIGFSSSKLSYLTHRLLHVHPEEKTIIFYTNNNTAFFIAEALELLQITFRIYANTLSVGKRAEYLAQFNTEDDFQVLLMDLKQAALGLHIAVASRVYIMSPIWDSSLESQAIKRAHRIGQNREVFVETLVLDGTFEEAMVRRRAETQVQDKSSTTTNGTRSSELGVQPSIEADEDSTSDKKDMLTDAGMVKVLKNIRFLKIGRHEEKIARLEKSVPLFQAPMNKGDMNGQSECQVAGTRGFTCLVSRRDEKGDKENGFSATNHFRALVHDHSRLPATAGIRQLFGNSQSAYATLPQPLLSEGVDYRPSSMEDGITTPDEDGDERPAKRMRFV